MSDRPFYTYHITSPERPGETVVAVWRVSPRLIANRRQIIRYAMSQMFGIFPTRSGEPRETTRDHKAERWTMHADGITMTAQLQKVSMLSPEEWQRLDAEHADALSRIEEATR